MPKDRIAELTQLINQVSKSTESNLEDLDKKVLENFEELSYSEKIQFYTWISEHLNSKLKTLPNFTNSSRVKKDL
jgi:hypothetical protein